jgi:hypothetical protein
MCYLVSAGGEFDFSLIRFPAHDCKLWKLCVLKYEIFLFLNTEMFGDKNGLKGYFR